MLIRYFHFLLLHLHDLPPFHLHSFLLLLPKLLFLLDFPLNPHFILNLPHPFPLFPLLLLPPPFYLIPSHPLVLTIPYNAILTLYLHLHILIYTLQLLLLLISPFNSFLPSQTTILLIFLLKHSFPLPSSLILVMFTLCTPHYSMHCPFIYSKVLRHVFLYRKL